MIIKKTKVHHYSSMYTFIFKNNKIIKNRVEIMLYALLWYTMVCYDEWKSDDSPAISML